jgi:hypothetical protein
MLGKFIHKILGGLNPKPTLYDQTLSVHHDTYPLHHPDMAPYETQPNLLASGGVRKMQRTKFFMHLDCVWFTVI